MGSCVVGLTHRVQTYTRELFFFKLMERMTCFLSHQQIEKYSIYFLFKTLKKNMKLYLINL
jgi:hypothetical protein